MEILCINIPYSDGWTAYVNGKKVNTERVNVMKLGIILKKGNKAYFGVGGGITYDSIEEDEYNETLDKAKALMRVL